MDISYSGGMDSTALAIWAKQQGHEITLHFADTGAELPDTLWFVPRAAKALGAKLVVHQAASFFQIFVRKGYLLPSFKMRWCTRELKIKALGDDYAIGICADESQRMEDKNRPLVDAGITKSDARKMCESAGLINPVYCWRSSCSCFCCPFQRKRDWIGMAKNHPDLYALAEEWEKLSITTSGFMFHEKYSLAQLREANEDQYELLQEECDTACAICMW